MEFKTATLNGKRIAFTDQTEFLVQVGRYAKGAYKTLTTRSKLTWI
jgi:hypothetical protein